MKIKRYIIPALLLLSTLTFTMNIVGAASFLKESVVESNIATDKPKQITIRNNINVYQYFNDASSTYEMARIETNAGRRSQLYADAIKAINNVILKDSKHGEAFLLASQIYRAKGGLSYADRYLKRANDIFYNAVQVNPQSIAANLDYAVFCFVTNATSNYNQEKKAQAYADKTLKLIEPQRKLQISQTNKNLLRYEALAYLVKGDSKMCGKLLAAVADGDEENGEESVIERKSTAHNVYDRKHTTANIFYHSLFKNTVMQQKWLWPASVKNVDKEFLLYYLTDLGRNEK